MQISEGYLMTFVPERFIGDEKYRRGHVSILAPAEGTRILGMHTPEMKTVAKALVRSGSWKEQIASWKDHRPMTGAGGLTHEERMIWGLAIDYARIPLDERLEAIEAFIPAIDNWAICDNFCCNAKWVEKEDKELVRPFVYNLIRSEEEFRSRVGLVLSLAHFLDEGNTPLTLEAVASRIFRDEDPYYMRMGAAWLFAEALCKRFDTAVPFITERRLARWVHNKAIQKACESWRIPEERKTYLRTLKY